MDTLVIGVAVVGVGGLALAYAHSQQQAQEAAAPPAAAPQVESAPSVAAPAQQAAQESRGGLPKLPESLSTLGTVVAGIKLQNAIGNVAQSVGGEGAGNVARVAPAIVGAGVIIGKGVERGLESIGVANEPARVTGLVTGVAVVAGAPVAAAVLGTQLVGSAAQEALRLVAGERVERAVSNAVSQLDPFKPGSAANTVIKPVAGVVETLGGLLGGGNNAEEERRRAEQEQRVQQIEAAVQSGAVSQEQVNQAAKSVVASITGAAGASGGMLGGLIQGVKQAVVSVAPSVPPPPPAPPPPPPPSPAVAAFAKAASLVKLGAKVPAGKAVYQP